MRFFCLALLLLFNSCTEDHPSNDNGWDEEWETYISIAGQAIYSSDMSEIEKAVEYLDGIIEKDGEKYINSIYYDKAQLLFRLGKNTEALGTLNKSEFNYDLQKAGLLILMGNNEDAQILLDGFLSAYIRGVNSTKKIEESHVGILVVVSFLSGRSFDEVLQGNRNRKLNAKMLRDYTIKFEITKEAILRSWWPDGQS